MQRVAYIDHYDSFTANLIDWLQASPRPLSLEITAFDDFEKMSWLAQSNLALIFSPGPKSPLEARSSQELIRGKLGIVPILGVCLGHQILGTVLGGRIVRSKHPFHGEDRLIQVKDPSGFLCDVPREFRAGVYHSLVVDPAALVPEARVTALDVHGECQVLEYTPLGLAPALGVQFHPESFLSDDLSGLRERWLDAVFNPPRGARFDR